jgi:hypothetical protein
MFAKTLAVGKGFCNHGTCQGAFPLDPLCCTPACAGASLQTRRWLDVGAAHWKSLKACMARPVKSEAEKLNHTVAFRLTDGDFLQYRCKFSASGFTQSEFFREHVLNNTTQVVARPVASRDSMRAVFLLQKASNNVNQLAHRANSEFLTGLVSQNTYAAILDQLQQLNTFMLEQTREAVP